MSGNNKHSVVVKSITRRPLLLPQILLRQHVCSTTGLRSFLLHELSGLVGFCGQIGTGTFDRTQIAKCRFRLSTKLLLFVVHDCYSPALPSTAIADGFCARRKSLTTFR